MIFPGLNCLVQLNAGSMNSDFTAGTKTKSIRDFLLAANRLSLSSKAVPFQKTSSFNKQP